MKNPTKPTKYFFSGREEDYIYVLRQFSLRSILMAIHKEGIKLLMGETDGFICRGVRKINLTIRPTKNSYFIKNVEVFSSPWVLLDLAYYAIVYTNDYCGCQLVTENDLTALLQETVIISEETEKETIESLSTDYNRFCMYLYGLQGEQFKDQMPGLPYDAMAREAYILFECFPETKPTVDIGGVIEKYIGVPGDRVLVYLVAALMFSIIDANLQDIKDHINWKEPYSWAEFFIVIDRYTTDYQSVRDASNGRQFLSIHPFVKTGRETICINVFSCNSLMEHALLWIARDACKENSELPMPSFFGLAYEKYIESVLVDCVPENYERIKEGKEKRADWLLKISGWTFIVEQKSALVGLLAKQQSPSVDVIEKFCKDNIFEALAQLHNTEVLFGLEGCVKIILMYEDYLSNSILYTALALPDCPVKDDGLYWMLTTSEFEMLMLLAKTDRDHFLRVSELKSRLEKEKSNQGRSINQLLAKEGIYKNSYLDREEFSKYKRIRDSVKDLIYDKV